MKIIRKNPNPSGAYPAIQEGATTVYEGHAVWPETLDTADFYNYNGFVTLTIEQANGVDAVTAYEPNVEAWETWKASLPEPEPEQETTVWDELDAAYQEGVDSV